MHRAWGEHAQRVGGVFTRHEGRMHRVCRVNMHRVCRGSMHRALGEHSQGSMHRVWGEHSQGMRGACTERGALSKVPNKCRKF